VSELAYTVEAHFADPAVAAEWIAWLRDGHLADVMLGGALDATVVRIDTPGEAGVLCRVHYRFASRESFARYEREFAPALRAEGLERFPTSRGITYRRSTGLMEVRISG
jgi:hypothetical protein